MFKRIFLVFIIIIIIGLQNNAWAGKNTFWLNLGLGVGTVDEGSTFLTNISYQTGNHVFTLRALSTGAAMLEKGKTMNDYGLLYNRAFGSSLIHVSAGVGLSIVSGSIDKEGFTLFSESEDEKIGPTIGLPLDIQLFWRPLSFIGLGIYGFGNLNPEESYAGFTICLQLGKLK